MRRPLQIGISGSYGGLNLGDEAILQSMLDLLRPSVPVQVVVFSRDAVDTKRRHPDVRAVPVRELARDDVVDELRRLDLLLLGGGGILYDGEAEAYLREVTLAHSLDVPVMVYAVGVGPLVSGRSKNLVREALEPAAVVTVRDRPAKHLLENAGVARPIQVTADPALLLQPEPVPADEIARLGLQPGRRLVGVSVREPGLAAPDLHVAHYHRLLADAADFMVERLDAEILLVPMERITDLKHSHAVVSAMRNPHHASVLRGEYRPGQVLSLIGNLDFAVGMRLHFLLFAALQSVPFVALPYASKVLGFLRELDLEMPPLENVTAGSLLAHIDRSWDERESLRARIKRRLPALRARALENHLLLLGLFEGLTAQGRDLQPGPAADPPP
jgi:polysaccharide pyruvyl transferase CsaB